MTDHRPRPIDVFHDECMARAEAERAPAASPSVVVSADRATLLRAAEALHGEAKRLTGEFNDSDILHEDGPAATVATWKHAAEFLRRMAAEEQPAETQASTAPLAAGLPLVKGRCPACRRASLFLGNGGYVTCSVIECAEPDAASTLLEPDEPWLTDSARIGRTLIWSWTDVGKGAFREGYRAAQAEARALLGGGRGTEQQRPAVGEQPDIQTREADRG